MGRTATVTVLMNDVVGSTALRVDLGDDRADELFADLVSRWRLCVLEHDGEEIKGTGDGLMVIFRSAADAASCGVAMQQAAWAVNGERSDTPVEIRVGVSAGEAAEDEGDWHGTPVVEAARLCDVALPGQVLVADVVRTLVGSRGDLRFDDGALYELKGLREPLRAFAVAWEPPSSAMTTSLPAALELAGRGVFVGRRKEFAELSDATTLARSSGRQLVLISGEPGQGKTRLAAEMAGRAAADGARVLFGRCDEDLQRAYRPWAGVVSSLIASLPDDALDRHLETFDAALSRFGPELRRRRPEAQPPPPLDADVEPIVLADVVADLLARDTRDTPTTVVLDDLHWADRPSLLLLKALLEVTLSMPLVIIGTYRDTDLDRTHPLSSLLGDLRRQPGVQRLALDGLDPSEVAEFVDATAGREVAASAADLVRALYAETNGNPLFLGEVLRYLVESGALVGRSGQWREGAGEIVVPEGLKEVVGRRLDRLPQLANDALQVAAVVGSPFDLAIVEDVLDADGEALIEALELATRSGIVDELSKGGERFQFRHAVLRTVVEGELSSGRRALLHRKVGDALERRYAGVIDAHLEELAFHRVEAARAGDANEAARWCVRAAEQALEGARFSDAYAMAERGWQVLELADAPDIAVRGDVALVAEWAAFWTDRVHAEVWLERAVADARALKDGIRLARAACMVLLRVDQMSELIELQAEALELVPESEVDLRRLLLGCHVVCLSNSGATFERVNPLSLAELVLARQMGNANAMFDGLGDRLSFLAGTPHLAERRALYAELLELPPRSGMYAAFSTEIYAAPLALSAGDRVVFEEHLARRQANLVRRYASYQAALVDQWVALLALLDGRFAEVESLAARQLEHADRDPNFLLTFAGQLVALQMQTGLDAEVADGIERTIETHPNLPVLLTIKAWACASSGREDEAREILDDLAPDAFAKVGRGLLWPACMAQLAEAIAALGTIDHARALYELLEPWSGQCIVVGQGLDVPGAVDRYLGMLAVTLDRVDEADARYAAASALEEKMQSPPLIARTRYWWGRALLERRDGDDVERARSLLTQCLATAEELGMTRLASQASARL